MRKHLLGHLKGLVCGGDNYASMGKVITWVLLGVSLYYWLAIGEDTPPNLSMFFWGALSYIGFGKGANAYKQVRMFNKDCDDGGEETGR